MQEKITDKIQHLVSAWKGHETFAVNLVRQKNPTTIVDLGVDYGFSTFAFALPNIGHVYGVDWFEGDKQTGDRDTYGLAMEELAKLNLSNVTIIKSKFSDAAKTWDKPIDILHIDGAHDYEFVKRDFEEWFPLVKDDGVILMHDTISFPEEVGRFFLEIPYPKYNFLHSAGLGIVCKNYETLAGVLKIQQ